MVELWTVAVELSRAGCPRCGKCESKFGNRMRRCVGVGELTARRVRQRETRKCTYLWCTKSVSTSSRRSTSEVHDVLSRRDAAL